jgi:hypothetical protein
MPRALPHTKTHNSKNFTSEVEPCYLLAIRTIKSHFQHQPNQKEKPEQIEETQNQSRKKHGRKKVERKKRR